jgi:hypothetical protein
MIGEAHSEDQIGGNKSCGFFTRTDDCDDAIFHPARDLLGDRVVMTFHSSARSRLGGFIPARERPAFGQGAPTAWRCGIVTRFGVITQYDKMRASAVCASATWWRPKTKTPAIRLRCAGVEGPRALWPRTVYKCMLSLARSADMDLDVSEMAVFFLHRMLTFHQKQSKGS